MSVPPNEPPPIPYAMAPDPVLANNIRLLGIFHLILGGMSVLFSTLPIIHIVIGVMMVTGRMPQNPGQPPIPADFGWIFVIMGSVFMLMGYALSVCMLLAGYKLLKRRSPTFCFVVACIECVMVPFGTVLGVFTIVVLSKPETKAFFNAR